MIAGTITIRTMKASIRIATPSPSPNSLIPRSGSNTNEMKTLAGVIERYRVLNQHKHELSEERESDVIRSYVTGIVERGQADAEFTREMPAGLIADMLKGMLMAACTGKDPVGTGEFVARVLVRGVHPVPNG